MKDELPEVKEFFSKFVQELQNKITESMRQLDPELVVTNDPWSRFDHHQAPGGGGLTRYHRGKVFEAAGVNTSTIFGQIDPQFAKTLAGSGEELWATGISLIIHPLSPKIPTVHANFRLIHQGERYWFGGGADLTPYYPSLEDFKYFHQHWKKSCDTHTPNLYSAMKEECDHYFTNHHRQDGARGIGGIFFDHYSSGSLKQDLQMVVGLAQDFISSYFPIVKKNINELWTLEDEDFQLHRRGRYVEFNLIHDRGTLFGLKTKGRTESILISLPPRCKFTYDYRPKPNTKHHQMMEYYFPKDWVNVNLG